jgi:hypothetical protein
MGKAVLYIALIGLLSIPAVAATHWLIWDDGDTTGFIQQPGYYTATTFTAPYDLEILAYRVYWRTCSASHQVQIDCYNDNSGEPNIGMFDSPVTGTVPSGG